MRKYLVDTNKKCIYVIFEEYFFVNCGDRSWVVLKYENMRRTSMVGKRPCVCGEISMRDNYKTTLLFIGNFSKITQYYTFIKFK